MAQEENLLMFYTGVTRKASDILTVQQAGTSQKDGCPAKHERTVWSTPGMLKKGRSLSRFGEILHAGWLYKQTLVDAISIDSINGYYDRARAPEAIGGNLLGAGGGAFSCSTWKNRITIASGKH